VYLHASMAMKEKDLAKPLQQNAKWPLPTADRLLAFLRASVIPRVMRLAQLRSD